MKATAGAIEDVYELSPLQQGILFHALYAPEGGFYIQQLTCVLEGELDPDALRATWGRLVARHPVLRTSFHWEEAAKALQVVHRDVDVPWRSLDWSGIAPDERAARLEEIIASDRARGFDPTQAPLMRFALIRLGSRSHRLIWTHHHILLDGWSVPMVLDELLADHLAAASGARYDAPARRPFSDHIGWLQRRDGARDEAFWRDQLAGFASPTPLPSDVPWSGHDAGGAHASEELLLSESATAALVSLAQAERVTLSCVIHAAWATVLARYAGTDDVVYGMVVSGRPPDLPGVEAMIGNFVNTVPFRAPSPRGETVAGWLRHIHERQLAVRDHEHTPLVRIQGWTGAPRGHPLFSSILAFENYPLERTTPVERAPLEVRDVRWIQKNHFPLGLVVGPGPRMLLRITYATDRIRRDAAVRLLRHLERALAAIAAAPDAGADRVEIMGDDERRRFLAPSGEHAMAFPHERTVDDLFAAHAAASPDAVAILHGDTVVTYGELDRRAERIARALRRRGVRPEERVGVLVRRSPDLVASLLAVVRAGGAFVACDPTHPPARSRLILEDARAQWVLTERAVAGSLAGSAEPILVDESAIAGDHEAGASARALADNAAYVAYTSGSTGRPKGAVCTHRSLTSYVTYLRREYALGPGDVVLQVPTIAFDAALRDVFGAMTTGAALALVDEGDATDPAALLGAIRRHGVTRILAIVPSLLRPLASAAEGRGVSTVRTVLTSAEPLTADDCASVRRAFGERVELVTQYGATECTMTSSFHRVPSGPASGPPPVGTAIPNTRLYVLDAAMRPVPLGARGGVHVGGVGVSRGYLGRPDLTAERFVPDPFGPPGERLYRTGDLGRWRADGALEILGRADHQVKVRGHRVELGEVESLLREHAGVREAAARAHERAHGRAIVGYVVPAEAAPLAAADIRAAMAARVPAHLVPEAIVLLDRLPRTASGKLDRLALPDPYGERPALAAQPLPPRTAAERTLAGIWADVLGVREIGVEDDLFSLGGDSLKAIELVARVREAFEIDLPLRAVFDHPTIAALAAAIEAQAGAGERPWSPLVALQPGGGADPLFLVHPSGGQVLCYYSLARYLAPDQPLYALQAADEVRVEGLTVEVMAERYVASVRERRPEGPYLLAGYSFGALVAYEMAQQLRAAREDVPLLLLLDNPVNRGLATVEDPVRYDFQAVLSLFPPDMTREVRARLESSPTLPTLATADRFKYIRDTLRDAGLLSTETSVGWLRRVYEGYRRRREAARDYVPVPYGGRTVLIRSSAPLDADLLAGLPPERRAVLEDPALGWSELVRGPEIRIVPGDHDSMIAEPHVETLARTLRECLASVHARPVVASGA